MISLASRHDDVGLDGESATDDLWKDDLYVAQDTYYPVQAKIHTTGSSATDITVTFTAVNTGVTVDLPPADHVQDSITG